MFKLLADPLAWWHAKLKNWHAVLHVGMPSWKIGTSYGTLARKNETLARFWDNDTQVRWHVNHACTQAHWHLNHAGTQARLHVDHVGTQARMACDLANSTEIYKNPRHRISNFSDQRKGMGKTQGKLTGF